MRFLFGDIHLIIGGAVEDHLGVVFGQGVLNGGRVGDVHLGSIPGHDRKPAMLEFTDKLGAKLSGSPEDYRASAHRNTTIAKKTPRQPRAGPQGTPTRRKKRAWKTRGQTRLSTQRKLRALGQAGQSPSVPGNPGTFWRIIACQERTMRCGDCFTAT